MSEKRSRKNPTRKSRKAATAAAIEADRKKVLEEIALARREEREADLIECEEAFFDHFVPVDDHGLLKIDCNAAWRKRQQRKAAS